MNKRGEERVLFFVFVLIVLVISGGITAGMYVFFNQNYDTREEFTGLLMSNVKECAFENDFFADNFSIFEECGMNDNFIDEGYAIIVTNGERELKWGIGDLKNRCGLNIKDKSQIPYCMNSTITRGEEMHEIFVGSIASPRRSLNG